MAWGGTGCFDGCVGDYDGDLAELKHHYGSAYLISHPEPDVWLAQRRDDRTVLRAESAAGLLEKIRDDYAAHPVSRRIAGPTAPSRQTAGSCPRASEGARRGQIRQLSLVGPPREVPAEEASGRHPQAQAKVSARPLRKGTLQLLDLDQGRSPAFGVALPRLGRQHQPFHFLHVRRNKATRDLAHGAAGEKVLAQLRDLVTKVVQQFHTLVPVRVHQGRGSVHVRALLRH